MNVTTRLTSPTTELVHELLKPRGFMGLSGPSHDHYYELIAKIEAAGEFAAVPYLATFAVNTTRSLRDRAAGAADKMLVPLTLDDLLVFDHSVRSGYYGTDDPHTKWFLIKPTQLSALSTNSDSGVALLGILSFHGNGYVREAALRMLARHNTGAELPFLLIRLNDWVPVVRSTARQSVNDRMTTSYARAFAANLSLLQRLSTWERTDHLTFLDSILEYLRKPECHTAVSELLSSRNTKTRRLSFALLAQPNSKDFAPLLRRALADQDPTIRLWSIKQARKHLPDGELRTFAETAIIDKYSGVRSQAAYVFAEQLDGDSDSTMASLVMDRASSLRSIGRYYLGKRIPTDFAVYYRDKLQSVTKEELAIAIRGLGEVGTASDADQVKPFARHQDSKVRTAAIDALSKLDGDQCVDLFVDAIGGGPPQVSKAASLALTNRASLVNKERLWAMAGTTESVLTRKRILDILFEGSKWDGLIFAIASSNDPVVEIATRARAHITRWMHQFNRSSIQPTPLQRERVLEALAAHGPALEPSAPKLIRYCLGETSSSP